MEDFSDGSIIRVDIKERTTLKKEYFHKCYWLDFMRKLANPLTGGRFFCHRTDNKRTVPLLVC